jgi:3-phenylpropionate/trans-cinnamate dioxygenase ferredoxin subunit
VSDEWAHVGADRDVPLSAPWPEVTVGGEAVALVRDDAGHIHAVRSSCPHLRSPMTRATVADGSIECSRHFYTYDLVTGRNTFPGDEVDLALPIHDVEIRDGQVWVRATPAAVTPEA